MNAIAKIPVRMTVEEFLLWADATPGRWELVDGEPRAMTPPLRSHGSLQAELGRCLGNRLLELGRDCAVVTDAGILPDLFPQFNMRMPDLVVSCQPYTQEQRAVQGVVLIAEILSPSNQADTWSNVWAYTSIDSVREILVLRADRIEAELLRRGPGERWPAAPERITDGKLVLDSVGFQAPLADLYRTTRLAPR